MSLEEICLHQFIRPSLYIKIDGVGDCRYCESHVDNKYCKRYYPINIQTFEVLEHGRNEEKI
jgi:hypothetical protein